MRHIPYHVRWSSVLVRNIAYLVDGSGVRVCLVGGRGSEVLGDCGRGETSLLRGIGRYFSSSSSSPTIVLSFLLKRAPRPNDLLVADLGLLDGSVPGDNEPYPESFEDEDASPLIANPDGGVR